MLFLDEAGCVYLFVEDHDRANAARDTARGSLHRGEQVRGPLGARERGMAHRARHDHGRVSGDEQVEHEGRLLYAVGTLSYHHARGTLLDAVFYLAGQLDQVFERNLRTGYLP